jgi:hypothetical protein
VFEQDLLDEEIKKKKRRVLIALLILFLLVALAALPRPGLRAPSPTVVAQGTATASRLPSPLTPAVEATSSPMATSGAGGTILIATGTASGAGGAETPGTPPVGGEMPGATLSATAISGVKGTSGAGATPAGGAGGGMPGATLSATVITGVGGTPGAGEAPAGGVGGGTPGATLSATVITGVEGTPGAGEAPAGGGVGMPGVTSTTTAAAEEEGGPGMGGTPVGVGGGTPTTAITATSVSPSGTALATSTGMPPGELPVTGVARTSVPRWLALGLVLLLLGAGAVARHNVASGRRIR